ncbi:MAG: aminoacyl-tRNA hydrolase [Candidatus Hodarchaeales archaeon]|jgi:PTH2 family peptidyl-tRNA hydrolase
MITQLPSRIPYRIGQTPDWISIPSSEYHKNVWRKYRSLDLFLDKKYGKEKWRKGYFYRKKFYTLENIIPLLKESISQYLVTNTRDLDNIKENLLIIGKDNINDLKIQDIKINGIHQSYRLLFLRTFQEIIIEMGYSITKIQLTELLDINSLSSHEIPFVYPNEILQSNIKHPWNKDSIEAFLRNNQIIQVRGATMEKKADISLGIFIRSDLKLGKGKKAVQAAHAAVSALFQPHLKTKFHNSWLQSPDRKIKFLKCKNLNSLLTIQQICRDNGVNENLISDAGHTQVMRGTRTCIAVGPIYSHWIDILSEH